MAKPNPCPACASPDVDPTGHVIGDTSGPLCRACGFWSARSDWTPAQNVAGWNAMPGRAD